MVILLSRYPHRWFSRGLAHCLRDELSGLWFIGMACLKFNIHQKVAKWLETAELCGVPTADRIMRECALSFFRAVAVAT